MSAPSLDVQTLRTYLDWEKTVSDSFLQMVLDGVVDQAGQFMRRPLTADPTVDATIYRRVINRASATVVHARSVSEVTVDGLVQPGGYHLHPEPGVEDTATPAGWLLFDPPLIVPYPFRSVKIGITGRFGWVDYPPALRDALYVHAARNARERNALYGDTIQLDDGSVVSMYRQFPARVRAVYQHYQVGMPSIGSVGIVNAPAWS